MAISTLHHFSHTCRSAFVVWLMIPLCVSNTPAEFFMRFQAPSSSDDPESGTITPPSRAAANATGEVRASVCSAYTSSSRFSAQHRADSLRFLLFLQAEGDPVGEVECPAGTRSTVDNEARTRRRWRWARRDAALCLSMSSAEIWPLQIHTACPLCADDTNRRWGGLSPLPVHCRHLPLVLRAWRTRQ